jgi:hypothetical protein
MNTPTQTTETPLQQIERVAAWIKANGHDRINWSIFTGMFGPQAMTNNLEQFKTAMAGKLVTRRASSGWWLYECVADGIRFSCTEAFDKPSCTDPVEIQL